MDFNEARLHEAILNLHMNAWIFSRLLKVYVDDRQDLSDVVFSALVGFSFLTTRIWFLAKKSLNQVRWMSIVVLSFSLGAIH